GRAALLSASSPAAAATGSPVAPPKPPSPPGTSTPGAPSGAAAKGAVAAPAAPVGAPKSTATASASVPGQRPPASPASTRASITDVVPRRTLAIIAAVVALAILGTILALTLGDGDGNGGKDDTAASAGASAGGADGDKGDTGGGSAGGKGDGQKEGQGKEDGRASEDPSGEGSDDPKGDDPEGDEGDDPAAGDSLPAGYENVTDTRFHFTMAMPGDFKRTGIAGTNSGGIYNAAQGSFPRVQVDFNSSPKDDAAAAWRGAVGSAKVLSDGYKHGSIKKVEYNGYPTVADWTFERNHNGVRVRVLNRGFKVDAKRGYSIMISCKIDEWDGDACRTLRDTAFATFTPTD
ncbi:serine/threonine protein kinase, partial [Streptomyces baarnensis]